MKIALIGYGKMGKAIEQQAVLRGHEIVLKVSNENIEDFNITRIHKADIAIEFTGPHSALENISKCLDFGIPLVCGSTGWNDKLDKVKDLVQQKNGSLIYASNFSLGVNLFFELNEYAAKLLAPYQSYHTTIKEIHHTAKLDAPSGTAITLAEGIIENNDRYLKWANGQAEADTSLQIFSERIDPAPGTHIVTYKSTIDTLELTHEAHSREGFALGAVIAAEWIAGKKGLFTMRDLFK
jgi:4-hydroxy-tetrahydrodipicolinate reductase